MSINLDCIFYVMLLVFFQPFAYLAGMLLCFFAVVVVGWRLYGVFSES